MASSTANGALRARQLLLELFSPFVQDQAALSSLKASSANLPSFAAELANAAGKTSTALGTDDKAQKETQSWLSKIEDGSALSDLKVRQNTSHFTIGVTLNLAPNLKSCLPSTHPNRVQSLETTLETRTYLAGPSATVPSAADYSLFAALFPQISSLSAADQHAHPSLARYVSHLSQQPQVISSGSKLEPSITPFEPVFQGMPRVPGRAPPEKPKKDKAAATAGEDPAAAVAAKGKGKKDAAQVDAAAGAAVSSQDAPADKKENKKKDKADKAAASANASGSAKPAKAAKGGAGGGGAAPATTGPLPSMIDLRVGKIVGIEKHPDADALYLEKVDFGEPEGPRQVLSGLVNFVPIEQMRDRAVVGICNLKPQAMRGIKSYAMLLCATHKDGKDGGVEPVLPPEGSKPGDRIWVEGYEGMDPEAQLNPKKKIFEAIQPGYCTTLNREAAWVGPGPADGADGPKTTRLLRSDKGVCLAPTFTEATLS
ncbi:G4 quadruplex nucleic acid binding protein [Tilletia horrida]|uniref:G4 quadruplex nucleic acid binding protein n=1 Tax=Tilletia horrida TaxID=155126 RepID=A0AAN6JR56_9BASI|nr:G4 quadruplex nucleic acid binding protein [Tilletia horrida]